MDGHRVLVVDDEVEIQEILEEYLTAIGYQVECAGTGREALDLLQQGELFDVALVDWTIPGIEGRDVMLQLHDILPDCFLFAITGHSTETVSGSAAGGLVSGIFRKPFSLQQLGKEIARVLVDS